MNLLIVPESPFSESLIARGEGDYWFHSSVLEPVCLQREFNNLGVTSKILIWDAETKNNKLVTVTECQKEKYDCIISFQGMINNLKGLEFLKTHNNIFQ